MTANLYFAGIPFDMTQDQITEVFRACGTVVKAKLIIDKATGKSKGFGFMLMGSPEEAKAAMTKLNGSNVGGRKIYVTEAKPLDIGASPGGDPERQSTRPAPPGAPDGVERRSGRDRRAPGTFGGPAPKPAFSERRSFGDKKPFSKPWGEKKAWGDKPKFGEKKPWGEKKAWGDKPKRNWGDKPRFGEKKDWGDKPKFGEKKPWGDKPKFGEKKAWGDKGDKKPWDKPKGPQSPKEFGISRLKRKFAKKEKPGGFAGHNWKKKPRTLGE